MWSQTRDQAQPHQAVAGREKYPLLSASLFSGTRSERSSDCPSLALR